MCELMMDDMYVVVIVIELYCLGCLFAGFKFGNYPSYRGDSAEISLETHNLGISCLS